jgi:hypothetical protein
MNAINRAVTWFFDLLLTPLESLGEEFALIVVSGVFGVLALLAFKHISSQTRIKATKDKIKGHMIEIRIYQNDLGLVSRAIGKVLWRNAQYVLLNFGPFVPLAIPFVFVLAQLVVRYGFEPVPIVAGDPAAVMAGQGTTLEVEFARKDAAGELTITWPAGLVPVSALVRVPQQGVAFQEFVAQSAGAYDITLAVDGEDVVKRFHVGADGRERLMQPERGRGILHALLWPAEDTFGGGSAFARVAYVYPESDLGGLPFSGPFGVLLNFFVASFLIGALAIKPLGVQI